MGWKRDILALGVAGVLAAPAASGAEPPPPETLRFTIHVHSTISTGSLELRQVLALASQANLDGIILTDSARRHWEYGLWPARHLVKRVVEHPSLWTFGIGRYLEAVRRLQGEFPRLIVLPGLEAAPFYYWRRSPFDRGGGEIRNWNQHLLVFGLQDHQAIGRLPLETGDPYHGDQHAAPYQRLIDAVAAQGGLVFWAHPMARHDQRVGSIRVVTDPYPHLLDGTINYDGLAISDLAHVVLAEPGGPWDRLLLAFLDGRRARPVWIIGELDWHHPDERALDAVTTGLMVEERSPQAALAAFRAGRMWVAFRFGSHAPLLRRFLLEDLASQTVAGIGGSLIASGPVRLEASGSCGSGKPGTAQVVLIKNGRVLRTEAVDGPSFAFEWIDAASAAHPAFYRLACRGPSGLLYTNPIFVR